MTFSDLTTPNHRFNFCVFPYVFGVGDPKIFKFSTQVDYCKYYLVDNKYIQWKTIRK